MIIHVFTHDKGRIEDRDFKTLKDNVNALKLVGEYSEEEKQMPEEISDEVKDPAYGDNDIEVTPNGFRLALAKVGKYDIVVSALSGEQVSKEMKIKFEYASSFKRNDVTLLLAAKMFGWSKEELDEVFNIASNIE